MVNSKRYNPTNKRFQKHTQSFVSGKTKKGHLRDKEDDKENYTKKTGILVRVDKKKMYEKGWEVKIDNRKIWCTYGDNILYLPPCNTVGNYYVPKKECKVEVAIEKKTKIYSITNIKDKDKKPIMMTNNSIKLESLGTASLQLEDNETFISGDSLSVDGDVKVNTSDDNDLPETITLTDMYKRIQALEVKLSDNNDIRE